MSEQLPVGGDLLVHLLTMGNAEAKKQNYALENKNVAIKRDGDDWKVYYSIIPPPGKAAIGGDFTILVDARTLAVTKIIKGR